MKILIVRTFPDILNINAYNVQEIGLAKALVKQGNVCDIVLYHGKKPDTEEILHFDDRETGQSYQIKIYWMRGFNLVKNGIMPSVMKILPQYDVIQVNDYDMIFSWMLYTKPQKPTVVYHGLYQSDYTKGYNLKCFVFDRMFLPFRSYQDVIAITKSNLAADFLRNKGFRKVFPLGVGVDDDNFVHREGHDENSSLLPAKEKVRLLYIGKIEDRRNSIWLLELLERLLDKSNRFELVIIGKGEAEYYRKFMEKASAHIKNGNLIYIPEVTQKQMTEIYPFCDVFLFPSNYEIFGMVLLEAMYFGLPVISSMNGGSSVLIDDGVDGRIVQSFEWDCWEEAVLQLIRNEDVRKEIGRKAGEKIRSRFLWSSLGKKFEEIYRKAINEFNGEKSC